MCCLKWKICITEYIEQTLRVHESNTKILTFLKQWLLADLCYSSRVCFIIIFYVVNKNVSGV